MKRLLLGGMLVLISLGGLAAPVSAGVDDFTFKEFVGDYYLSRDDEGRARLRVVETFVAEFPEFNQNKGLYRAIPATYDGHSVAVQVESLTRGGQPEPIYDQRAENGYWVVETGDDTYVRGEQTYVLTYTIRDIVKDFGGHQEAYGDTVGTNWQQPFGRVVARVHMDDSVRSAFTGDMRCLEGTQGSTTSCQVSHDGATVTFMSNGSIGPHENLSMIMKFAAGTFEPYKMSGWQQLLAYGVPIMAMILSVVGLLWAIILRVTRGRDAPGRGTIVPEYLPPADVSVVFASGFRGRRQSAIPAQLIDMAVRHKIDIIEEDKKTLFGLGGAKKYTLRVLSIDGLSADDGAFLSATTGRQVGETYTIDSTDSAAGQRLQDIVRSATGLEAIAQGYRRKLTGAAGAITLAVVGLVLGWIVTVLGTSLIGGVTPLTFFAPFTGVVSLIVVILLVMHRPLTDEGIRLKEYLEGLELYIKIGEQERLQVLQSPQGADKTPVDISDTAQIVRLYERVLPYAVLFGLEKEWAKVLEVHYGETGASPSWYHGTSAFNAAMLGSAISGFSSSAVSSFAPPSSSSGSGFSSGGGFSGGGFGGGGGGGR